MKIKVFAKGKINSYKAEGIYTDSEKSFIVCKGSQIWPIVSEKIQPVVIRARNNRALVSETGAVLADIKFRSPSTAASFVAGHISDGNKIWKDENGRSLGEIRHGKTNE